MATAGERLTVWMHGQPVATLAQQKDRLVLSYTEAALRAYDVNTPLLSVALPVYPKPYKHDKVRPFFDGLLPEGAARRMLAYDLRLAEEDSFGLLRALGRDCAGALVFLPEGEPFPGQALADARPLAQAEVVARLRQLETEPLGVDGRVRISLAGVQQKLVLSLLPSGEWALPLGGLPSTHILKRADRRFEHMVANEAFCLALGRRLGLSVVEASIMRIPEEVLVVTRYDRRRSPKGDIQRLHQEDVTQALAIASSAKYQHHGGPSLRDVARLLRETTGRVEDVERLFEVTFLNVLVGNADAHAKNFSLLHPEPGHIRLAPAYDILSTSYYPHVDVRPGMDVNGKRAIAAITTADLIEECVGWKLNSERLRARTKALLAALPAALTAAAEDVPSAPPELIAHIRARAEGFIAEQPSPT